MLKNGNFSRKFHFFLRQKPPFCLQLWPKVSILARDIKFGSEIDVQDFGTKNYFLITLRLFSKQSSKPFSSVFQNLRQTTSLRFTWIFMSSSSFVPKKNWQNLFFYSRKCQNFKIIDA